MANGQRGSLLRAYRQNVSALALETQTDTWLLERFSAGRDQAAFEELVRRHGPLVLGLCRRLLRNASDVEDAFQATFLVLVRKAGSISRPHLLGNWLYGVAYRVAVKARVNAARRSARERQAASMPTVAPIPETPDRELREVLDEEINRLPEKYRTALVLCYLEGKTNAQAARQLGCPAGSMSWRLARGREMLRRRLSRRRLDFALAVFPLLLVRHTASAAVPPALMQTTVHTAVTVATGGQIAGYAASVEALADETLGELATAGVKRVVAWTAAGLLAWALLFGGAYTLVAVFGRDHVPLPALPCLPMPGR